MRYADKRRAQQTAGRKDAPSFPRPMTVLWGEQDRSAVVAMAGHLGTIRPATEVITWLDVAHWSHYEVPQRAADHIFGHVTAQS